MNYPLLHGLLATALAVCLLAVPCPSRAAPLLDPEVVPLWPEQSANNPAEGTSPTLEIFHPFNTAHAIPITIVILPGGGYAGLSPYERMQAYYFRALGYTAVVVNYRVLPHHFPAPFADATRAIRLLRRHADEWNIPAGHIALLGGSAGGHLAALVATRPEFYHDPLDDLAGTYSARPDRLILLYPVIAADGPLMHASIDRLLGPDAMMTLRTEVSPEKHISHDTPPTLVFHAADDPVVDVQNSITFAEACWLAQVDCELHVFPTGGHGMRFAYDARLSPRWRRITEEWLTNLQEQAAGTSPLLSDTDGDLFDDAVEVEHGPGPAFP